MLCSVSSPQLIYTNVVEQHTIFHYYLCRSGSGEMEVSMKNVKILVFMGMLIALTVLIKQFFSIPVNQVIKINFWFIPLSLSSMKNQGRFLNLLFQYPTDHGLGKASA